jgi:hypothetical protein
VEGLGQADSRKNCSSSRPGGAHWPTVRGACLCLASHTPALQAVICWILDAEGNRVWVGRSEHGDSLSEHGDSVNTETHSANMETHSVNTETQ